ncbi:ribonuclease H-like domain-containing protein [candidate division KSB1 bacterium]|nr:ribonuclease H-like domain-containing protein [candidate division KSB1 bacterium]MBL7092805.1 ribonuclease H-like domain-containing protein [candidate division KSB1 bacterium]
MNIREKLRFIEQIDQPKKKSFQLPNDNYTIDKVIDGEIVSLESGETFVRTLEYDTNTIHGSVSLNQIENVIPDFLKLAGKDTNLLQIDLRNSLFFDTETTGLAGGSGTYILLAGFGFFKENQFILKQFFLRDIPEEFSMLKKIHELINQFDSFVSFNGKSYDLPLLKDRFTLQRIRFNSTNYPHLDLLHASRRVWKNRLPDCSLGTIERSIMDVFRDGDVPSYLIPELYFEYLRTKDARPLKKVFYHNKIDILSLVSLTILLHNIHKNPFENLPNRSDLLTLTKHYANMNQWKLNIPIYENLLDSEINPSVKKELEIQLAFCYKRTGNFDKATQLWHQLVQQGKFRIEPFEELAKYYEHKTKNLKMASQIVEKALENLNVLEELGSNIYINQDKQNMIHRLNRIKTSMAR